MIVVFYNGGNLLICSSRAFAPRSFSLRYQSVSYPRRVRFHLPGTSSSVDETVVVSAECDEESKQERKISEEDARRRKVKISIEDSTKSDKTKSTRDAFFDGEEVATRVRDLNEKQLASAARTAFNDPTKWVGRIMHPWADYPVCCPEYWDKGTQFKDDSTLSLYDKSQRTSEDQNTMANLSFESTSSSNLNDVSSVTPILPPFPTSSQVDEEDDLETEDTRDEKEMSHDRSRPPVLGIRSPFMDDDGASIVEEVERHKSPELALMDYFDSGHHKPQVLTWRRKPHAIDLFSNRTKPETHIEKRKAALDDEFDVESYYSEAGLGPDGDYSKRLFEI